MSSCWFNIRILLWHFQITKGDLFRIGVSFNPFWWRLSLLWKPVWIHDLDVVAGWMHRGSTQWKAIQ